MMPISDATTRDALPPGSRPGIPSAIFSERIHAIAQYFYLRPALGVFMVTLLGLSSLSTIPAVSATPPAQSDEVQVIVKGVAVPYSVFGIVKRLEQIPGVAKVNFDMRHGLADIKLIPGAHITDEQLRAAIKNASYTPGDIHWVTPTSNLATTSFIPSFFMPRFQSLVGLGRD